MTAEDFKKHFSKQSVVTDVKFIPNRRIGYVGYKSPEDATRAVKYHNKSFIRTSRIGVELARSVEEQSALRAGHNSANATNKKYGGYKEYVPEAGGEGQKKRKREAVAEDRDKATLQEFLEVMQPPSKSKMWENQDAMTAQTVEEPTIHGAGKKETETRSDEEYEPVPKKQKSERKKIRIEKQVSEPPQAEAVAPQQDGPTSMVGQTLQVAVQEPSETIQTASDADWLRSRTSRLLGLVDDDDGLGQHNLPVDGEDQKAVMPSNPEHIESTSKSDASVQMDDESKDVDDTAAASPPRSDEDSAIGNGRLFVRNLTYTITEEELRQHLESRAYGTTEEVSLVVAMPTYVFNLIHIS